MVGSVCRTVPVARERFGASRRFQGKGRVTKTGG